MKTRLTSFHTKPRKPLKRSAFKPKAPSVKSYKSLRRTKIRVVGHSSTAELKRDIQALCRLIGLDRDGGCVFRDYPDEAGECGGHNKKGDLILQFDHLNSRVHAISFSNPDLGVIACQRHHIFWKPQYPAQYEKLVREIIGWKRCALLDRVRADHRPYKVDLKLEKIALEQQAKKLGLSPSL